jgi:hypothetical protein
MVRKRALERWETKLANCEVTPQAVWPVAKSLTKEGGPKAPSAIQGPLSPIFYPFDKANIISDCLENQFTAHSLCCDCCHRQQVEATDQALLATVDEDTPAGGVEINSSSELSSVLLSWIPLRDCPPWLTTLLAAWNWISFCNFSSSFVLSDFSSVASDLLSSIQFRFCPRTVLCSSRCNNVREVWKYR